MEARACLKHFPSELDMEEAQRISEELWGAVLDEKVPKNLTTSERRGKRKHD